MLWRRCTRRILLGKFAFFLVGLVTSAGKSDEKWINRPFHTKPERCWVYTHMNKSGGSTVKTLLLRHIEDELVPHGLISERVYNRGESVLKRFIHQNYTITAGGYTEGLRKFGGGFESCKWFTMFRHPIARLVSAYFYCMGRNDQLCGSSIMRTRDVDLHTFAEHWGNYGLRQFALSFVPQDELLAVETAPCTFRCPPWYKAKVYLEERFKAQGGRSPEDLDAFNAEPSLSGFLEPAKKLLKSSYSAVGLLEDWTDSMRLFNRALELPNFNWTSASSRVKAKKHNEQQVKVDTLASAWDDPVLKQILWLDILLYDHAVAVHNEQLSEYGLL
ncbi:unnamed protein product [Scytosiphon promiscuus]